MTTTNTFATKVAVVGLGLAVAFSVFAFAPVAKAQTTAELQAQIQSLLATIAQLQAQMGSMGGSTSSGASMVFTRDLTIGSSGSDVTALQNWLIGKGHSIAAGATGYFGAQTQAALAAWQAANGVSPAAGYFGPVTRAKVNAMAGGSTSGGSTTGGGTTSGDLEGGAGSISDADFVSGLNSEEVGEDEEDVEIIGLEIEADDGSDIMITAVTIDFDQGTADEDFEDVATEVSVWLDGEEFAREDANEFTDDDNFSKTVSLDDGAIIRADETADLTVAVSGASNIDSGDAGDTWDVAITSVRFEDADGASVTDNGTGDIDSGDLDTTAVTADAERSFTFNTFASAADIELKAKLDNESPDAQVINVDSTDETDGVEIMRFTLEAEGGEVMVKDLPITFTTVGGSDVDSVINTAYVEIDGEEFSENVSTASTAATVTFDDIDFTIGADETVEVVVKVDLNDIDAGTFDEGDTLKAEFTASNRNAGDYEDETGEDLTSSDKTGTALGDEMAFYDTGIMVTFVSASEDVNGIDSSDNDSGTFEIKYRVEAFDGTAVISDTATATTDTDEVGVDETVLPSNGGVVYILDKAGTATTVKQSAQVTFTTSDGATDSGITNGIELTEGESTEVTLTVVRTNSTATDDNGLYRLLLEAIAWATSDTSSMNAYDFDFEDYKTDPINLD